MVGTPVKQKLIADIAAMGGEEVIFERIANGDTITAIAAELGVSRPFLSGRLNRNPQLKMMLAQALSARADRWAEETLEIADGLSTDKGDIDRAKVRIDTRRWLAGVESPEKYGAKGQTVNVSVGALHLEALKQAQQQTIEGQAVDVTPPDTPE